MKGKRGELHYKNLKSNYNKNNKENYLTLVLLHVGFAFLIALIPIFSKIYFIALILFFLHRIFNAPEKEKHKEVIMACCYVVGSEVLFRMTSGAFFYEGSKYLVILFAIIGLFYNGFSNKAYPYFIYLILLIPSIIVAYMTIGYDSNFRTNIAFVLSGPVCLGISALYLLNKKLYMNDFLKALLYLSLPIITMTVYLFLYSPSIKDILKGTQSNFAASGGFGPNQVATVLGLGMFALTVRFFMKSPTLTLKIFNGVLLGLISFRGIVTFSRGGIITAVLIIIPFLYLLFFKSTKQMKGRIIYTLILFSVLGVAVWFISSNQTMGLIDKRYANQDVSGRDKEDLSTGRVTLFMDDLQGFIENPLLGVGANGAKELRLKKGQGLKASHNELSRLFSEHGTLAFFILLILIFVPLLYRLENKRNIFFYSMLGFWFATINHSAMRIAAPGFIYALALLNVYYDKRPLCRKRLIKKG
ncbi:O-antigen ligase family protein [Winogradskyella alexanderae]|uniref:O-antigen ligase family protein n=1 Tax=Winogradskyella alexanderae TaxID=2877123 RepID=A0ABS7XPN1_9FLAO|nr:O-antigen ligase family protein [Winogradskyella alexanderae]MCA0131965.1 O-antigen ligase family protein [Winogradskyella alexanderae]